MNIVDVRGQALYSGARVWAPLVFNRKTLQQTVLKTRAALGSSAARSFYVYSDGKGLGAEEVLLEPRRARAGDFAFKGARIR